MDMRGIIYTNDIPRQNLYKINHVELFKYG